MKAPGDTVALGDTLGYAIEPGERWGRLVGIRKDECRPMDRFLVRCYQPGDGEYPTGGYRTTWLLVPWMPEGGS